MTDHPFRFPAAANDNKPSLFWSLAWIGAASILAIICIVGSCLR